MLWGKLIRRDDLLWYRLTLIRLIKQMSAAKNKMPKILFFPPRQQRRLSGRWQHAGFRGSVYTAPSEEIRREWEKRGRVGGWKALRCTHSFSCSSSKEKKKKRKAHFRKQVFFCKSLVQPAAMTISHSLLWTNATSHWNGASCWTQIKSPPLINGSLRSNDFLPAHMEET